MYTALYRSHRPEVFDEILGQEHIVRILKNQVSGGTVSHAYLFCGTRGTGKTTTARILAKAVNCLSDGERPCGTCAHCKAIKDGSFMDVIEIDAASNNGVENIRELRESVKYPPAAGRKKVYIIDEVHMLSTGAFNALLKTLEEPPEHVMFILATTEPQKLPSTILSRCMRLDFRRVSQKVIAEDMAAICGERGVEITDDAARLLANCADGSVRDGLSILDQVLAGGDAYIDREKVLEYVGTIGEEFFIDLTELVSLRKSAEALILLNGVLQEGKDVKQIMKDWVSHYRSLLITKFVSDAEDMLNMSAENLKRVSEQSRQISVEEIDFAVTRLSKTINDARWSTNPRVLLELAIVAIASGETAPEPAAKGFSGRRKQPVSDSPAITARNEQRPGAPETVSAGYMPRNAAGAVGGEPSGGYKAAGDCKATGDSEANSDSKAAYNDNSANSENAAALPSEQKREEREASRPFDETGGQPSSAIGERAPSEEPSAASYAELWHGIFEENGDNAGSFNLIRSGTELHHIGSDKFTVLTGSSFTLRYVEQKRAELEKLMTDRVGRPMKLICRLKETADFGKAPEEDAETEKIAREAGELLGIDIEIE